MRDAKLVSIQIKKNREDRRRNKEFMDGMRNMEINLENNHLLDKLVDISTGKWSSVPPWTKRAKSNPRYGTINGSGHNPYGPGSLNILVRNKESLRIEKEN